MNDFKKDLQVKGLLTNNVIENLEKQNYKTKKLAMCKQFHRNSKIHKYLHNLVATIMIEHYNSYPYSIDLKHLKAQKTSLILV